MFSIGPYRYPLWHLTGLLKDKFLFIFGKLCLTTRPKQAKGGKKSLIVGRGTGRLNPVLKQTSPLGFRQLLSCSFVFLENKYDKCFYNSYFEWSSKTLCKSVWTKNINTQIIWCCHTCSCYRYKISYDYWLVLEIERQQNISAAINIVHKYQHQVSI